MASFGKAPRRAADTQRRLRVAKLKAKAAAAAAAAASAGTGPGGSGGSDCGGGCCGGEGGGCRNDGSAVGGRTPMTLQYDHGGGGGGSVSSSSGGPGSVKEEAFPKEEEEKEPMLGCPYYTSQALAQQAQLVLCPYSYLLDPQIRQSMQLSMEGSVVLLDEAHNIEDVCRDAGSIDISAVALMKAVVDLCQLCVFDQDVIKDDKGPPVIVATLARPLLEFAERCVEFVLEKSDALGTGTDSNGWLERRNIAGIRDGSGGGGQQWHPPEKSTVRKWALNETAGTDFWNELVGNVAGDGGGYGGGPKKFNAELLRNSLGRLQDWARGMEHVTVADLDLLAGLLYVIGLALDYPQHYCVVLQRWPNTNLEKWPKHCQLSKSPYQSGLHQCAQPHARRYLYEQLPDFLCELSIWLMSPAVIFESLARPTRTIALTSGTLSPLASFRAELGADFSCRLLPAALALEAHHVVSPKDQLRVCAVPSSPPPHNRELRCVYANTSDDRFVEQLGWTVAALTALVPSGVLVFLPSYALMRRAARIWRRCGAWDQLIRLKGIVVEVIVIASAEPAARCFFLPTLGIFLSFFFPLGNHRLGLVGQAVAATLPLHSLRRHIHISNCSTFASAPFLLCCALSSAPRPHRTSSLRGGGKSGGIIGAGGRQPVMADLCRFCGWCHLTDGDTRDWQEPTSMTEFAAAKRQYEHGVKTHDAALLLAVYRGKMSEGISFNDAFARAVLCIGIPFPNAKDLKVNFKKEYNDWMSREQARAKSAAALRKAGGVGEASLAASQAGFAVSHGGGAYFTQTQLPGNSHDAGRTGFGCGGGGGASQEAGNEKQAPLPVLTVQTGNQWYQQQAFRALNQALGRCIRHIYDYGVIFLLDSRHVPDSGDGPGTAAQLARWIRGHVTSYPSFGALSRDVTDLFQRAPGYIARLQGEAAAAVKAAAEAAVGPKAAAAEAAADATAVGPKAAAAEAAADATAAAVAAAATQAAAAITAHTSIVTAAPTTPVARAAAAAAVAAAATATAAAASAPAAAAATSVWTWKQEPVAAPERRPDVWGQPAAATLQAAAGSAAAEAIGALRVKSRPVASEHPTMVRDKAEVVLPVVEVPAVEAAAAAAVAATAVAAAAAATAHAAAVPAGACAVSTAAATLQMEPFAATAAAGACIKAEPVAGSSGASKWGLHCIAGKGAVQIESREGGSTRVESLDNRRCSLEVHGLQVVQSAHTLSGTEKYPVRGHAPPGTLSRSL
ncbi:unnamed protein product [Phaeothamnion confervicola]